MDNVDLAPLQPLSEPAAISGERLESCYYKLPGELASRLDKASRNEGVDASSFLLAAFTVVLNRYVHADSSGKANAAQTFGDLARSFSDDTSVHFDGKCIDREVTVICWDRLLFCAKEAIYKAWYSITKQWLDFSDCHIVWDPCQMPRSLAGGLICGDFVAHLKRSCRVDRREIDEFQGRYVASTSHLATLVQVR
ncbi:MAG: 4'-phosphopantetheinyl transferase superfamily protein [Pirellula sp.]